MNKNLRILFCGLLLILFILFLDYSVNYQHEIVHKDVAVYAGCKANTHINFFKESYTLIDCNNVNLSSEMKLEMYRQDLLVEHNSFLINFFFISLIGLSTVVLFFILLWRYVRDV